MLSSSRRDPERVEAPAPTKSSKLPEEGEGTDWVAGDGTSNIPDGFSIKGNASSKIYHPVESNSYEATIAEIYFASPEAATRAGYRPPKNLQVAGEGVAAALADAAAEAVQESDAE